MRLWVMDMSSLKMVNLIYRNWNQIPKWVKLLRDATNQLNKYNMKSKTIKEIAVWLKDRIDAGQHEENGSMDYTNFGRIKVIIQKEEGEYIVWMNDSALPDFSVTEQSTLKEIKKAIEEWAMTWLSE